MFPHFLPVAKPRGEFVSRGAEADSLRKTVRKKKKLTSSSYFLLWFPLDTCYTTKRDAHSSFVRPAAHLILKASRTAFEMSLNQIQHFYLLTFDVDFVLILRNCTFYVPCISVVLVNICPFYERRSRATDFTEMMWRKDT